MKKLVVLLFVMLQFGYILEAKESSSKAGVPYYDCHIECFELYKFEAKRDLRAHYADVIYANIINIVPEN